MPFAVLFLPEDDDVKVAARELDLPGFLLLSPGLVLFLYGSDHLGERTGIAAFLLSVILLAEGKVVESGPPPSKFD